MAIALPMVLLAGCATSTDPREGGLLGGIQGLGSGAYDSRVQEREARLEALRRTQRELEGEQGDLEARKAEQTRQVAAERTRLDRLNADVAALDREMASLSAQHGRGDQRVRELQTRLTDLKQQMGQQQSALDALEGSGLGDSDTDLRRRQLEQQRQALQKEYELLMQLSLELAR
ncbi:hypothetical protein [Ectothiorhodospira lacustris]|nr:hypothetical protein [Ectothiorhodospira lacustris]MCG5502029.1 hypothetical protein [Ectothiorhodospira lacustris]